MQWNEASHFEFIGKSMEMRQHYQNFTYGGKEIVEQILASEKRNKSKRAGLWGTVRDPSMKVNHLSKVIWDRKIITGIIIKGRYKMVPLTEKVFKKSIRAFWHKTDYFLTKRKMLNLLVFCHINGSK